MLNRIKSQGFRIQEDKRVGKNLFSSTLYWFFVGCLLLVTLEIAANWLNLAPKLNMMYGDCFIPDPVLPYKLRPYSVNEVRSEANEFDFCHEHNSMGFRDVEHLRRKPEGVYRILGLGDSFTYGAGASFEETYLFVLESILNNELPNGPVVEVIKAGIPGYFTEPERLLYEHTFIEYKPDLIIVGFNDTDVFETYLGMKYFSASRSGYLKSTEAERIGALGEWLYINSHAARIFLRFYLTRTFQLKYKIHHDEINQDNGYHEPDWIKIESELARLIRLANENKVRTLILHIPYKGPYSIVDEYPEQRLRKFCSLQNSLFCGTFEYFQKHWISERLFWNIDSHCTPAGYSVIAQLLAETICSSHLITP